MKLKKGSPRTEVMTETKRGEIKYQDKSYNKREKNIRSRAVENDKYKKERIRTENLWKLELEKYDYTEKKHAC